MWGAIPEDLPIGPLRTILTRPMARMRVDLAAGKKGKKGKMHESLLQGTWEACLPLDQSFELTIQGCGELVDSWESRLGLGGSFAGKQRWTEWKVTA
jgi:hypothetical protein